MTHSAFVTYQPHGRTLVVTIDNPPVNALSDGVPEGIGAAIRAAIDNAAIDGVVVICAGRTFIAGADITLLERTAWGDLASKPDLRPLLRDVESCSKPVVMAIHGTALGGGLELAMAASYRIALRTARLGLPEVTLGVIPGAEGTQRLPRLVGVEAALNMVVTSKPVAADDALAAGLIDEVVDGDLLDAAVAFASHRAASGGPHPKASARQDRLGTPDTNASLFAAARALAKKIRPHQPAPLIAIDAIEAATRLPFPAGSERETELFLEAVKTEPAKALIHVFFAERAVSKVPGLAKDTRPRRIERVGIIGAGTMGSGIAMACANAGLEVRLQDQTESALTRSLETIRRNYATSVKRGRFTEAAVAERLDRIHPQRDLAGFEAADLIIEAAFEDLELKRALFRAIDEVAKPGCILATNTSTLSIDDLAASTSRQADVIGLHFFSPANVMRLLEIVRGAATAPDVVVTAQALAKMLGKVGVVVGNGPGFVGNRMLFPYLYECQFLIEDGATPQQVDAALTRFGMAMGLFAVDDMAGIDVAIRVRQAMGHFSEPGARAPLVQPQLHAMGRLGQKTGKGWYTYGDDRKPVPDAEIEALIRMTAQQAGIPQRAFTDDDIVERTVYALINEGARALEAGLALRASDIDIIYTSGYGFPAWRGGPMFYADRVGLDRVLSRVRAFHAEFGDRWAPAPLLEHLAASGWTFRGRDQAARG
ncbi:MAG: 3-hydroxyacyl-CoA dehydrogenase NAD-binding domain-containing protein [Acidobacteriota bacterium]